MKNFKKLNKNKKRKDFSAIAQKLKPVGYVACGILIGVLVMILMWPDRIATLKNGEERIISVEGFDVSANDLYNELKKGDPISAAMNIVDGHILHEKYPNIEEEAKKASNERAAEIYKNFETYYGYSKTEFLDSQGFESEEKFIEYLVEEYYYQKYFDEYTRTLIDDEEINDFYKDKVIGDTTATVFSGKKEDLQKAVASLKKGKSVADVKKANKDLKTNDVSVTYKEKGSFTDSFWTKLKSTKVNTPSDIYEDSEAGLIFIYVTKTEAKPDLKDIKEEVENLVVAEKQDSESNLRYKAFEKLREDNNLKFYDTELENLYKEYVKSFK